MAIGDSIGGLFGAQAPNMFNPALSLLGIGSLYGVGLQQLKAGMAAPAGVFTIRPNGYDPATKETALQWLDRRVEEMRVKL